VQPCLSPLSWWLGGILRVGRRPTASSDDGGRAGPDDDLQLGDQGNGGEKMTGGNAAKKAASKPKIVYFNRLPERRN